MIVSAAFFRFLSGTGMQYAYPVKFPIYICGEV